jgi:hypothetical protein
LSRIRSGLFLDEVYPKDLIAPCEDAEALNAELRVYMKEAEARFIDVEGSRASCSWTSSRLAPSMASSSSMFSRRRSCPDG